MFTRKVIINSGSKNFYFRSIGVTVQIMFPQPKRHKRNLLENDVNPFPVDSISSEPNYIFSGYFTGINVEIFDAESIKKIYENGCFGIGSKTQAAPKVLWKGEIAPVKVPQEIFDKKCEWREKIGGGDCNVDILIDGPDSLDPFHIEETLVLTLEESFFLHSTLKCLSITDCTGRMMQTNEILTKFCKLKTHFWTHFVAYSYLRSKNWIVKCGLKFGGDFRTFIQLSKFAPC